MTIILQWLVEHAWIFYVACALGGLVYLLRALAARRERNLALFTLERETATARLIQSWAMLLVFVAIGALTFASTTFILPALYNPGAPSTTPTLAAGVEPSTPVVTLTPTPTLGFVVPTLASTEASVAPPPPPAEPSEVPTPVPTDTPEVTVPGGIRVRFSDFAALVGYALPATEFTTAQPLPLTLYWQGLEGTSPTNYVVFTHLLAVDGRLIAQHDSPPASGTRPTTTWVAGETIVDLHALAFTDLAYVGPAKIAVGLYDPAVGRVPTETGDDRVILPITISIVPQ